ncbi:MAG: NAD(P)/FAD-dependent oxidoreductase [Candidatus Sericytochromatia bacterium]
MNTTNIYDCAIIGGGLAGLTLSIQLAKIGYKVVIFERHKYPFHKVCGEYISNESYDFLERIGLNLKALNLPDINEVRITSPRGFFLQEKLDLGGFGISRYKLDSELANIAKNLNVEVLDGVKVNDITKENLYTIVTNQSESENKFRAKIVCGAFGKYTPAFIDVKNEGKFIGVKYHLKANFPDNLIELNNFEDGYCGISKIEDDKYCMCYLTTTDNLKNNNNDIKKMEQKILYKNKNLKKYFNESTFLYEKPVTISQIYFGIRKVNDYNILLLGDALGCIAPLFGNGMSIAMRTSFELSKILDKYFKNNITIEDLYNEYQTIYDKYFTNRIKRSIFLQNMFGNGLITDFTIGLLSKTKFITKKLIENSHGDIF